MDSGEFKTLMIPQSVQDCAYKTHGDSFGPLLAELTRNARGPPSFYDATQAAELLRGHERRLDTPRVKPRLAVFCAGVGCDALAALAAGYEIVLLVDVCPHSVEILKLKFPNAIVLKKNLMLKEDRLEIASYKDQVDAVLIGIPCQVSSDADPHRKPDDERLELTELAMLTVLSLHPKMISVENVCGFRTNRPAYFEKVLSMMRKSKFTTEWFETNAMDFGAPTRRRRLFMIGHKFMEADAKPTMAKLRADLFMQEAARKRGEKTCRDIYETLSPWINLRGFKGIMVHQLRRRGTAKDRPPRIIGIHRSDKLRYGGLMPTITSKYRQSAKQLRDYKHRPGVDEASKDKTHLADGQDLSCLQGLARRTQWSEARRCHDECPGCFLPPTTSRPDSRSSRSAALSSGWPKN
jgi:site-specific DNA-cytosine methylase